MGPSGQTVQIQGYIDRLLAGDETARDGLIKSACERMERLTHNMLKSYPRVQRWEQTDDVFQNAVMRLYRSLADIKPKTSQDFFRLAALNIRRELLDLVKHYYGPRGQGAKHATLPGGEAAQDISRAPYDRNDLTHDPGRIALWHEFHQKVENLPDEERQIFDLLWYQGLTQAEAADILKVTERTVKRRWQSARLMVHDALHGEMPEI